MNLRIHGSFLPRLEAAARRDGMKKTAWARMAIERAIEESERRSTDLSVAPPHRVG
jgi:hypothetical protein